MATLRLLATCERSLPTPLAAQSVIVPAANTRGAGQDDSAFPAKTSGKASTSYVHRLHDGCGADFTAGGAASRFGAGPASIPLFDGGPLATPTAVTLGPLLDTHGRTQPPLLMQPTVLWAVPRTTDAQAIVADRARPSASPHRMRSSSRPIEHRAGVRVPTT